MSSNRDKNERGNILITVLWVIVTLAIIVLGLNYEARSDVERTILARDRARAYWFARSGVERVKYDYALYKSDPSSEDRRQQVHYTYQFEGGWAECLLKSRTSMMSINTGSRQMWAQVLSLFQLDETDRDGIIDAILDWRDADDHPAMNGAEVDYYQTLTPPYFPRNGPFQSVEELLLVRGITEDMYYGYTDSQGVKVPGLKDVLSLQRNEIRQFDINSCPPAILMAFLEIDRETAELIIAARREDVFEDLSRVGEIVALESLANLQTYFLPYKGTQFIIRSTGFVEGGEARYTVEDEVRYVGGARLFSIVSHTDFSLEHADETAPEEEGERR